MKNSVLIAAGALLVGVAGGYLAGSLGKQEEEVGNREAERASKTLRTGPRPGGGSSLDGSRPARSARDLREVLSEPGQSNRVMRLIEYYGNLRPEQFESEMQRLQGLPMSQRMLAMNLLFSSWAEVDPLAAFEQSRTMGFPEMFMARSGVVSGWAASDPEGLAQRYTDNPDEFRMRGPGGRGGGDTVAMVAGEWAKQNPTAALEWARKLGEDEVGYAIGGIFNELARKDPDEALRMASSLTAAERSDAYRSIAETWAISDYDAADKWIATLSGEEQGMARFEAIDSLAEINPKRAAQEALKLAEGEDRDGLIAEVSQEWARESPGEALDYLVTNGTEASVEDGIVRVMGNLARVDAVQARDWLDAQPAGDIRDRAVQGYLFGNSDAAAAESIALAESISDERRREDSIRRAAFQWVREDEGAALDYVQTTTALSDEAKQRLLEDAERVLQGGGEDRPFGRGPGGPRGRP